MNYLRPACRWSDCWCRAWPPMRLLPSTGQTYTVEEIRAEGRSRWFRYVYA